MWLMLILLALITFGCRYIFLEPRLPIRLGFNAKKFLSYSAPSVLAAIAAPIIFLSESELMITIDNRYLCSAMLALIIMIKTQRMLLTVVLSFLFFIGLGYL